MKQATSQQINTTYDTGLQRRAFGRALHLFHEASRRVPAYRNFLTKAGINPNLINAPEDYRQVPPTDKQNYINQYSLAERSWEGELEASYISTSSGSTGEPFFWPRGKLQDRVMEKIFRPVYEDIFDTGHRRTLLLISFGFGTWIAGFELYNATKSVADRGNLITLTTPSIDKAEVLRQIQRLSPDFEQVILAGYPPFVKDILDSGRTQGVDWTKVPLKLLTAGEAIGETWRRHMLQTLDKSGSLSHVINYYGMAETGTVAHETPFSVLVRPFMPASAAGMYQYRPSLRFFESGTEDTLLLTSPAGLPLIRYNTRDRGGLMTYSQVLRLGGAKLQAAISEKDLDVKPWRLPFVYLYGRRDLSASLYSVLVYPENVKAGLEDPALYNEVTGMFIMETKHRRNQDQFLEVRVELAQSAAPTTALRRKITEKLRAALRAGNSEYNRLYAAIGKRAELVVKLEQHGQLPYQPGRKHKWVKRA